MVRDVDPGQVELAPGFGNIESVGRSMLSDFVYPFEVISLILLVAVVAFRHGGLV